MKAGLSQEHLIEGCPDALPAQAVHLYPFHQRIGRPPYRQGGGDTQHMAEKSLGGEAVLGVQQEHAGEHDKHRHTPVGQPVVHVEHHKIGRSTGDASRAPPVMWTTITASMAVHRNRSA